MIENEWTKTLDCMRQTLQEREDFISQLVTDNVKLQEKIDITAAQTEIRIAVRESLIDELEKENEKLRKGTRQ
jgi:hypothetical protein